MGDPAQKLPPEVLQFLSSLLPDRFLSVSTELKAVEPELKIAPSQKDLG